MSPRILPFGDRALLAEVDELDEVLALHARLAATRPAGVVDLVPAARTVLVRVDPARLTLAAARSWLAGAGGATTEDAAPAALLELPIAYDGADLAEVADLLGLTPRELAVRHAACEWKVAFTGFAPGFGYLVSPDWTFDVPRRTSPRTRVPAGAVGLAGEFSGAYPRDTPGGWQLIGTTPAPLFDPGADPPALLEPGTRVRFVPAAADEPARATSRHPRHEEAERMPGTGAAARPDAPPVRAETAHPGPNSARDDLTPVPNRATSRHPRQEEAERMPETGAAARPDAPPARAETAHPGPNPARDDLTQVPNRATSRHPRQEDPTQVPNRATSRHPRQEETERMPGTGAAARPNAGAGLAAAARPAAARPGAGSAAITVREPGLLATIQDQGRPGHAAEGVAVSGAADRAALRTANRLVGNAETAAGIEVTMGGLRLAAEHDLWFAVTGAWGPLRLDGERVDPYIARAWPAGAELHLDWFEHGARGYLAVRGGIDAPDAVGSRSTDLLAGLGPARLAAGQGLALAADLAGPIPVEDLHPWGPPGDTVLEIELGPGPRAAWFADPDALFAAEWTVSNEADRVGIHLEGPELARRRTGELPSEGMVPGALQVPPSGRPVILGPDGPVTGGYPVIAVVTDAGRDALAQARPGTRIRFRHARPAG